MKKLGAMGAVLVALATAGCKMNLTADIYTSDIRDVVAGTQDLSAPARLAIQVPSIDKCDEHTADIGAIMDGVVTDFSPRGCERVESESFLVGDIQVPLVTSKEEWNASDSLFGVYLVQRDGIGVAVFLNQEKFALLSERLRKQHHVKMNLADSNVTLVFNNDQREPAEFAAGGAFVNGEPVSGPTTFTVERRHRADIRLSNVDTAYLAKHGTVGGFVLKSP